MMTLREMYTTIRSHLLAQNARAENPYTGEDNFANTVGCQYRATSGFKCAVGGLIPDEHYNPAMEGAAVRGLQIGDGGWYYDRRDNSAKLKCDALAEALNKTGVPATKEAQRLLRDLQEVHDYTDPVRWANKLDDVACRHGLVQP